jgi:hypothetical protein
MAKAAADEVLLVILDLVVTGLVQRLVNQAVEEVLQCPKASNYLGLYQGSFYMKLPFSYK